MRAVVSQQPGGAWVHQILWRQPTQGRNLSNRDGVGPVATSLPTANWSRELDHLLTYRASGEQDRKGDSVFCCPLPTGHMVFIHRHWFTLDGRMSPFAQVLFGSPEILTIERVLALWEHDWNWPDAAGPFDYEYASPQPIDMVEISGIRLAPPTRSPEQNVLLDRLIIEILEKQRSDLAVVARWEDRRALLTGLATRLGPRVLANGFSTFETKISTNQTTLPPFVFIESVVPQLQAGGRLIVDLSKPAPMSDQELESKAAWLVRRFLGKPEPPHQVPIPDTPAPPHADPSVPDEEPPPPPVVPDENGHQNQEERDDHEHADSPPTERETGQPPSPVETSRAALLHIATSGGLQSDAMLASRIHNLSEAEVESVRLSLHRTVSELLLGTGRGPTPGQESGQEPRGASGSTPEASQPPAAENAQLPSDDDRFAQTPPATSPAPDKLPPPRGTRDVPLIVVMVCLTAALALALGWLLMIGVSS